VWFVSGNTIGRLTPAGVITNFPLHSRVFPQDIVWGGDGNLWFTGKSKAIGRITPTGTVTYFTRGIPGPASDHDCR
jgi:virginiamycin B lyase